MCRFRPCQRLEIYLAYAVDFFRLIVKSVNNQQLLQTQLLYCQMSTRSTVIKGQNHENLTSAGISFYLLLEHASPDSCQHCSHIVGCVCGCGLYVHAGGDGVESGNEESIRHGAFQVSSQCLHNNANINDIIHLFHFILLPFVARVHSEAYITCIFARILQSGACRCAASKPMQLLPDVYFANTSLNQNIFQESMTIRRCWIQIKVTSVL